MKWIPLSPPPPPSFIHLQTSCVFFPLCFLLCVWFSSDKRSHRPLLISSDPRYAFTATNRFWFHRSASLERGIQSTPIPHFRYDMIRHGLQRHRFARRSSVPSLKFGYRGQGNVEKDSDHSKESKRPGSNDNADDPSYHFTPEPSPLSTRSSTAYIVPDPTSRFRT